MELDHEPARREEMVRLLLAAGANVNLSGPFGTPLISAGSSKDPTLVQLLLAAGANVNATTRDGYTALLYEVLAICGERHEGSRETLRMLLKAGAEVNVRCALGWTPLSIARKAHDAETEAILLQAGAKEETINDWHEAYPRLLREHMTSLIYHGGNQPTCELECQGLLRKRVAQELGVELPREYLELLRVTNGLDSNGLMIYASETIYDVSYWGKKTLKIEGVLDANQRLSDHGARKRFLFLARSSHGHYVYDLKARRYKRLHAESFGTVEELSSFDELMGRALDTCHP
jgi:hypothetical protein